jgi:hypothetical protein
MPHYYAEDPAAQAVVDSLARELERLEDFLNLVRKQWFPQNAADDYGQLGLREAQLGIPVEPLGVSLEQRRAIVHAYERARLSGSGEDWIVLLTIALGATVWEHEENDPGDYDLRITIPYAAESYTTAQVEILADVVTPAHLNIAMQFEQGFVVGVSRIGDLM